MNEINWIFTKRVSKLPKPSKKSLVNTVNCRAAKPLARLTLMLIIGSGVVGSRLCAEVDTGPIGPRVLPEYSRVMGMMGYGADYELECSVLNGRLVQVRLVRGVLLEEGRSIPVDVEHPQEFAAVFLHSIESALKLWRFPDQANGGFRITVQFKSVRSDSSGGYVLYRYFSSDSQVPRRIEVEAHYVLLID
jgi:hypothetical protein